MANTLKHKTLPAGSDQPGFSGVTPSIWGQEHAFASGTQGATLVYNTNNSDSAGWVASVAGLFLSTGTDVLPSFATSLNFNITTRAIAAAANNTYDIGASATRFNNVYCNALNSNSVTVAGVGIIASDGRIPALSSTYFANLSAANLTSIPAASLSIASQATGDILYASSATVWSRLAVAGAGNFLQGGTTPSWGKISAISSTNFTSLDGSNLTNVAFLNVSNTFTGGAASFTASNFGMELGNTGSVNTPFIDFHSSGNNIDYDSRIIASGGTASIGNGTITLIAAQVLHSNGGVTTPSIAFTNETNTGFYLDTGAVPSQVNLSMAGTATATFTRGSAGSVTWPTLLLTAGAWGTTSPGSEFRAARNTSGGGAPGIFTHMDKFGAAQYVWVDSTSVARVGTTAPTPTLGDTGGTVIGTQTSTRAVKDIVAAYADNQGALQTLLATPLYRFTYKNKSYNNQEFVGITTDDSPVFGMDLGRSFNPVTAFGYTVASFKAMHTTILRLQAQVAALESRN